MTDVVLGDDGLARCSWGSSTAEYRAYHDGEWGRPVESEDGVFEHLCLEGFQSGLSWLTILRKREAFREVFASFDPAVVAGFGEAEGERLLADARIVRNRAKILATIANAKATLRLREEGHSLPGLVWSYRSEASTAPERLGDVPSSTPESVSLSRELRRHGFAFVGPTTVYAAMQSIGVVNDHLIGCAWRKVVEQERQSLGRRR
jgi:DNA-3-methyladenine glycosylase I